MEELRLFTIADLREWVETGIPKEGLSEAVIPYTRAYSFIHNPYAKEDMPVVSCLLVDGEVAAYTASFPEKLERPLCTTHWINSLYVSPKYEGKGYGLFVVGSLMECYENDPVFDLDAVDTSVEILNYLGLSSRSIVQYVFRNKMIQRNSLRGHLAYGLNQFKRQMTTKRTLARLRKTIKEANYWLGYDNFLDKEAYEFMVSHSEKDVFLRSRETINWMIRYPFVNEAPLKHRIKKRSAFPASKRWQRYYVVKVFHQIKIIGVYILCDSESKLSLSYFYCEPEYHETVLLSVAEHILKLGNQRFSTTNADVADFIKKNRMYDISAQSDVSFCYPIEYEGIVNLQIQNGDGDMFLN